MARGFRRPIGELGSQLRIGQLAFPAVGAIRYPLTPLREDGRGSSYFPELRSGDPDTKGSKSGQVATWGRYLLALGEQMRDMHLL